MALSLAIGLLIDDAMWCGEHRPHLERGETIYRAREGTSEIGLACWRPPCRWSPCLFRGLHERDCGRFFFQFGITVAFAVLVSLFVSFTSTDALLALVTRMSNGGGSGTSWRGSSIASTIGSTGRRTATGA